MRSLRSWCPGVAGLALSALVFPVPAQEFPARAIRIVVPFVAGGVADVSARIAAEGMQAQLGQTVVIENVTGATGSIGVDRVRRSTADGYTMLLGNSPVVVNATIRPTTNIDLLRDFDPVIRLGTNCLALVAAPALNLRNTEDLVALARARPGELSFASVGQGSLQHLVGEMFKAAVGIDMTHVPFRGEAQAAPELIAGRVHVMFMGGARPYVEKGQLVALGTTAREAWPFLPNVPAIDTVPGLRGFWFYGWNGLLVPVGTPGNVITRLNVAANAALTTERARAALAAIGFEVSGGTPGELGAQIREDMQRFRKLTLDRKLELSD